MFRGEKKEWWSEMFKKKEGRKEKREGGMDGWIPVLKMIPGLNDIPV